MGRDVQPVALIVGAQGRAIAQAKHLHFSIYSLETTIRAVGTFRFSLIPHPQRKPEGEERDMSFRLSPTSRAFYSTPSGRGDTSKFGSRTTFKMKKQNVCNHKMF